MTTSDEQEDRLTAVVQRALQGQGGNLFVSGWANDLARRVARVLKKEDRIWLVEVPSRVDGTYIFLDRDDAERFAQIVGEPVHEETLITPGACAEMLIASEQDEEEG